MRSVRLRPEDVPPELADNPIVRFWQTMTPDEEDVAEHLAGLDQREHLAELERQRAEAAAEP